LKIKKGRQAYHVCDCEVGRSATGWRTCGKRAAYLVVSRPGMTLDVCEAHRRERYPHHDAIDVTRE
jgi:hypothetical protein